jgi:hypothetical protein
LGLGKATSEVDFLAHDEAVFPKRNRTFKRDFLPMGLLNKHQKMALRFAGKCFQILDRMCDQVFDFLYLKSPNKNSGLSFVCGLLNASSKIFASSFLYN